MKLGHALLAGVLACAMMGGCAQPQVAEPEPAKPTTTEQEEGDTMREYATVEETGEDYFVVRTTTDELYQIDAQFGEGYEVGDLVLVVYEPAQKVQEGDHYLVTPTRVEASSTSVVKSYSG